MTRESARRPGGVKANPSDVITLPKATPNHESVGVGVGLVMLAREGLSLASLRRMEEQEESSAEDVLEQLDDGRGAREDELVTPSRSLER